MPFSKAYAEAIRFFSLRRIDAHNHPWRKRGSGSGRRRGKILKPREFYETQRVSGVYQKLLKSGKSIAILTARSHTDIDKNQ